MEQDPRRSMTQPSVEDEVHRVLKSGEQTQDQAADAAHDVANKASDAADKAKDQASSVIQQATDKAKDLVQNIQSKDPSELASDLKDKASEIGSQAADKTDDAMTATGQGMQTLAQTVRDNAPSGKVGEIATSAAGALEKGGTYLQQSSPDAVRNDLEEIIRRNPIPALLVGLGIGFLVARSLRR